METNLQETICMKKQMNGKDKTQFWFVPETETRRFIVGILPHADEKELTI